MILRLQIKKDKKSKKNKITVWIQKGREFEDDLQQIFAFFKDKLEISSAIRLFKYYKITSNNPAIMMSLFSAIHDIIPDIYFKPENETEAESVDLSGSFILE